MSEKSKINRARREAKQEEALIALALLFMIFTSIMQ